MTQEQAEPRLSQADMLRWAAASLLAVLGLGGFYYFAEQAILYRVLGLVAALALATYALSGSAHGLRLRGFMRESRMEVRKMVWATRAETLQTSLVVFVAVLLMAVFLWLLDRLLSWAVSLLLG